MSWFNVYNVSFDLRNTDTGLMNKLENGVVSKYFRAAIYQFFEYFPTHFFPVLMIINLQGVLLSYFFLGLEPLSLCDFGICYNKYVLNN